MNKVDKILKSIRNKETDYLFSRLNVPIFYNLKGLELLEERLKVRPPGDEDTKFYIVLVAGCFLGDTVVKNFSKAKWIGEGISIYDYHVQIEYTKTENIILNPFSRVEKFFMDNSYNLSAAYQFIKKTIHNQPNLTKYPSNKWIKNDGYELKLLKDDNL